MIKILKYGEVTPEQVFSRVEPAVNVGSLEQVFIVTAYDAG